MKIALSILLSLAVTLAAIPLPLQAISIPMVDSTAVTVPAPLPDSLPGEGPWVVRAHFSDRQMVADLAAWREPWQVSYDENILLVDVGRAEYERMIAAGFRLEIDEKLTAQMNHSQFRLPGQIAGIPGYPCYRTVQETYLAASEIAGTHPNLATWVDMGDSWEKVTPDGSPGYDLRVLRLSNAAVPGPKPKLLLISALHAREYATAELTTRFAEYLVDNYNLDADVTWLLDYHEIHLLLIANPDGRVQAETGLSWRKNTNENYCSPTSTSRGADLNRNFAFQWNCCGGSSGLECDSTYRGPVAASEPETQVVQDYMRAIFPDQRDADLDSAAPVDATGLYIDVHSHGELVVWPWGFDYPPAPNGSALQTLGRKLAHFNEYYPEQAAELYPTDGASDDSAYGELGVAAYTFELGNAFFQSCSYFENEIVPGNIPAFLYAASVARTPYLTPAGPDVLQLEAEPLAVVAGDPVLLTASLDDTRYQNLNGIEPSQNIAAAEYTIDVPPWITTTSPITYPMSATDGLFDEPIEVVEASVDSSSLAAGRHTLFIRGQDADNNWGPVSASFLYVVEPGVSPVIRGSVREAGTGAPLAATVTAGPFETTSNPSTGAYSMTVISGTYDLHAASPDHASSTVPDVTVVDHEILQQDFDLYPTCAVLEDDVEAGEYGWTASGSWAITDEDANSPSHSWTDSPDGNYGNNWDYSLTSAPLNLSEMEGVTLSFWHRYDLESNWDYAYIETSVDGVSWTKSDTFTGSSGVGWTEYQVDLPKLDGQNNARLRFRIETDVNTVSDGWHIDDIMIQGGGSSCLIAAPEASFDTSSPDRLGETTVVTNTSTGAPPVTYTWDFGDGTPIVSAFAPTYTYPAAGVYQITLTATNMAGTGVARNGHVILPLPFTLYLPIVLE